MAINNLKITGTNPMNMHVTVAETGEMIYCVQRIEVVLDAVTGENVVKLVIDRSYVDLDLNTDPYLSSVKAQS